MAIICLFTFVCHGKCMVFRSRKEAGQLLAKKLSAKYSKHAIVVALARGGIVVGYEIAKILGVPLLPCIIRKIGYPFDAEYALAVVSEHGEVVGDAKEIALVDREWFGEQVKEEKKEIERRKKIYLQGKNAISLKNKIVILVDDGIATGFSIRAAMQDMTHERPKKIIVAVPVISQHTKEMLELLVDEVVAIDVVSTFQGAVGAYYREFQQVSDEEVVALLENT